MKCSRMGCKCGRRGPPALRHHCTYMPTFTHVQCAVQQAGFKSASHLAEVWRCLLGQPLHHTSAERTQLTPPLCSLTTGWAQSPVLKISQHRHAGLHTSAHKKCAVLQAGVEVCNLTSCSVGVATGSSSATPLLRIVELDLTDTPLCSTAPLCKQTPLCSPTPPPP